MSVCRWAFKLIFSPFLQAYCKHNLEMNVSVDNVVQVSNIVKAIFIQSDHNTNTMQYNQLKLRENP